MMPQRLSTVRFIKRAAGSGQRAGRTWLLPAAGCLLLATVATMAVRAQQAGNQQGGGQQPAAQQPNGQQPNAQQPADQTQLTFRAGINFVTVDAYVSDSKGQPATDLKQSDFEVTEDNR